MLPCSYHSECATEQGLCGTRCRGEDSNLCFRGELVLHVGAPLHPLVAAWELPVEVIRA